jgi:LysM repeat protein/plastocyanin/mono/diheme cytochrome c family protein
LNTQKQIALMIALMFVMTASCAAYTVIDLPVRATDQQEWHDKESVERGALLYANNCRTCHGIRGEGFVGPALNTDAFKDQDPLILTQNRALILRTLNCGRAGTLMPAWLNTNGGPLNERQIEHLVNLLTAPAEEGNEEGTNFGWAEAVHFAHNLNHEVALVVSGDTLGSIARQHDIGVAEVLALNSGITDPNAFLPEGTTVRLPAIGGVDEREYEVEGDRESIAGIVDSQSIGAMILAEHNQIPFDFDADDAVFTIGGKPGVSQDGIGLFPGAELQLPEGSVYVLRPGDTIDSIAATHGVEADAVVDLNEGLISPEDAETADALDAGAKLQLPENPTYVVQEGDTAASIAEEHGLAEDALAGAGLAVGATIDLPGAETYTIQPEDTLALVAALHGISEADLASLNGLQPNAVIRPEVLFALPEGAVYVVQGQSLADIADTLGGVDAADIGDAQEPAVPEDHVYAIGTTLHMPPDSYGSAPPDAINQGTACVQHAVSAPAYEQLIGGGAGAPEPPEEFSEEVVIQATQTVPEFDWIVVADGESQPSNEGVAKITPGTTVTFDNVAGLHTITVNGQKEGEDIGPQPETREFTFSEPGQFEITCDYHPAMLAWIFVEEAQ